jgi:hypothetical protein
MSLWDDQGPISQGKILTAILQDREGDARFWLRRWSLDDLNTLERAADRLSLLCREVRARRSA